MIRAGFYVSWDPRSFTTDLGAGSRKSQRRLPRVAVPRQKSGEPHAWRSMPAPSDLLKSNNIAVVPMLSNYFNDAWQPGAVQMVTESSPARRQGAHRQRDLAQRLWP